MMLAEDIRKLRVALGLNLLEFSFLMITSRTTVARWESNVRDPSPIHSYLLQRLQQKTSQYEPKQLVAMFKNFKKVTSRDAFFDWLHSK